MSSGWLSVLMIIAQAGAGGDNAPSKGVDSKANAEGPPKKVVKTLREWEKTLTRPQFLVTRMKQTEPAFTGRYVTNHARGTYHCVCCEAPLFGSKTKFDSGTGWPSFWKPASASALETAPDYDEAEPRVEVKCSRCDAHLGHVFSDGPPPTGLRYCINSVALKFAPEKLTTAKPAKPDAKPKSKAASSKGRATAKSTKNDRSDKPDDQPSQPRPE